MGGTVTVKQLVLGDRRPKICVPLCDATTESLVWGAVLAKAAAADLVEWRADYYEHAEDTESVLRTAQSLYGSMGETPLLFTLRTKEEGGQCERTREQYEKLCHEVIDSGFADAIDIELSAGDERVERLVDAAQKKGIKAIVSSHDFQRTPPREAMLNRLARMCKLGADIPKLAVMPRNFEDVLSLLAITESFERQSDCPVITVSMGKLGVISRISGAYTGSALTFGTAETSSAPGQLGIQALREILEVLERGENE
ncbi:type I 3-dehydroquinate dehydratase [Ruminococcaceae bacterium OttesenSCG-928-I18]|nr:type I 3-dehydroquinate dehydratase [Ruminococcaceae bacterium OttesenSCG-928-I18]